jgi:hypothetical protein
MGIEQIVRAAPPVKPVAPTPATFHMYPTDAVERAKLPRDAVDPADYRAQSKLRVITAPSARWVASEPVTSGNSVVPYIYGRCVFADVADALATVARPGTAYNATKAGQ